MNKYFGVNFEFDHLKFENKILQTVDKNEKGYCCFIDLNSLVNAHEDSEVLNVLNNAMLNSCDGSYIAMLASLIHKKQLKEYIGPDFFSKFIYYPKKHLIIGNTEEVFNKIKLKVKKKNNTDSNLHYLSIPFLPIEDFDFDSISKEINELSPDYIWISLGAPKQELFMSNLMPYLDRGVLLGIGAATNYFSGEINDIPNWTRKLHIIWIYRIFTEPKKQISRMSMVIYKLPKILKKEFFFNQR